VETVITKAVVAVAATTAVAVVTARRAVEVALVMFRY